MSTKIDGAQKISIMAQVAQGLALIALGEAELHKERVKVARQLDPVFEAFGPGPHKVALPFVSFRQIENPTDPSGPKVRDLTDTEGTSAPRVALVTLRKAGDVYLLNQKWFDEIT